MECLEGVPRNPRNKLFADMPHPAAQTHADGVDSHAGSPRSPTKHNADATGVPTFANDRLHLMEHCSQPFEPLASLDNRSRKRVRIKNVSRAPCATHRRRGCKRQQIRAADGGSQTTNNSADPQKPRAPEKACDVLLSGVNLPDAPCPVLAPSAICISPGCWRPLPLHAFACDHCDSVMSARTIGPQLADMVVRSRGVVRHEGLGKRIATHAAPSAAHVTTDADTRRLCHWMRSTPLYRQAAVARAYSSALSEDAAVELLAYFGAPLVRLQLAAAIFVGHAHAADEYPNFHIHAHSGDNGNGAGYHSSCNDVTTRALDDAVSCTHMCMSNTSVSRGCGARACFDSTDGHTNDASIFEALCGADIGGALVTDDSFEHDLDRYFDIASGADESQRAGGDVDSRDETAPGADCGDETALWLLDGLHLGDERFELFSLIAATLPALSAACADVDDLHLPPGLFGCMVGMMASSAARASFDAFFGRLRSRALPAPTMLKQPAVSVLNTFTPGAAMRLSVDGRDGGTFVAVGRRPCTMHADETPVPWQLRHRIDCETSSVSLDAIREYVLMLAATAGTIVPCGVCDLLPLSDVDIAASEMLARMLTRTGRAASWHDREPSGLRAYVVPFGVLAPLANRSPFPLAILWVVENVTG